MGSALCESSAGRASEVRRQIIDKHVLCDHNMIITFLNKIKGHSLHASRLAPEVMVLSAPSRLPVAAWRSSFCLGGREQLGHAGRRNSLQPIARPFLNYNVLSAWRRYRTHEVPQPAPEAQMCKQRRDPRLHRSGE